jgi:hypothetical protein
MSRFLRSVVACLALVSLTTADASVQSRPILRPDFSGTWMLAAGSPAPIEGPLGSDAVIAHDNGTISFRSGRRSTTCRLDGNETPSAMTTVSGERWAHVPQARWVTNALLITTTTDAGATGRWEDLLILSLNGENALNVVTVSTAKSAKPHMITRLWVYERK